MANERIPGPGERWKKMPCKKHEDMPVGIANIPLDLRSHPCAACNARLERLMEMVRCGCFRPAPRIPMRPKEAF